MDAKLNPEAKLPSGRDAVRQANELPPRASHLETTSSKSDLQRVGRYLAKKEVFETADVPLLLRSLLDHSYLHGQYSTVRGRTVVEILKRAIRNKDQSVVRPADKPLPATSGVAGLTGNPAPNGAPGKVAGMAGLQFTRPARCFDGEEARFGRVKNKSFREGEVLVIRYEGPRRDPGMRENAGVSVALSPARQKIGLARCCAVFSRGAPAEKACHANL